MHSLTSASSLLFSFTPSGRQICVSSAKWPLGSTLVPAEGREMALWKQQPLNLAFTHGDKPLSVSLACIAVFLFALFCHDTETHILD